MDNKWDLDDRVELTEFGHQVGQNFDKLMDQVDFDDEMRAFLFNRLLRSMKSQRELIILERPAVPDPRDASD